MNVNTYPTGNNYSSNDGNQGDISKPSFPLKGHQISENSSKKRCRSTNSLIERNGKEPQRNVTKHNGYTEDETQGSDLEELKARANCLHRYHLHPCNGDIAKQTTSSHMTHGKEDRVLEPVIA